MPMVSAQYFNLNYAHAGDLMLVCCITKDCSFSISLENALCAFPKLAD